MENIETYGKFRGAEVESHITVSERLEMKGDKHSFQKK